MTFLKSVKFWIKENPFSSENMKMHHDFLQEIFYGSTYFNIYYIMSMTIWQIDDGIAVNQRGNLSPHHAYSIDNIFIC